MATCPRCKGHLTDGHRCPRRPAIVALEIAASGVAGGLASLLLLGLFDPHGETQMDALAVSIGALAAIGINRLVRS